MYYLVFDTETTGLPISWSAPVTKLENWPRLVQLAWVLYDEQGHEVKTADVIVRPDGFSVPYEATRIHGISHDRALREGVSIMAVLTDFVHQLKNRDLTLVAHNIEYDEKVMGAELLRARIASTFFDLPKMCTMKLSTAFCQLPNGKQPRLSELHKILFGEYFDGAHNALTDTKATGKCFFELKKRGVIVEPKQPVQRMLF